MSRRESTKETFLILGGAILAAVIAVRGTLSMLPDFIRYDRYGDTRGIVIMAMWILGICVAGLVVKALEGRSGDNQS